MSKEASKRIAFARAEMDRQRVLFRELFGNVASQWKHDGTRVTEADLKLSAAFQNALHAAFPEDGYFSEESDCDGGELPVGAGYSWLIDPIDGTNNFARGMPQCSISLALLKAGQPIYGWIYDYSFDAVFHGGPGFGLFRGDAELRPERDAPSAQSFLSSQCYDTELGLRESLALQQRFKIRAMGSTAIHLAYVAAGLSDGSIAHANHLWDIAAAAAMLEAVGCGIHYFEANPWPLKTFKVKAVPFGYIAGDPAMIAAIRETIGR